MGSGFLSEVALKASINHPPSRGKIEGGPALHLMDTEVADRSVRVNFRSTLESRTHRAGTSVMLAAKEGELSSAQHHE